MTRKGSNATKEAYLAAYRAANMKKPEFTLAYEGGWWIFRYSEAEAPTRYRESQLFGDDGATPLDRAARDNSDRRRVMLEFAGEHPVLTFLLVLLLAHFLAKVVCYPIYMAGWTINRISRARTIRERDWPPAHLDGDGDFAKPPAEDSAMN